MELREKSPLPLLAGVLLAVYLHLMFILEIVKFKFLAINPSVNSLLFFFPATVALAIFVFMRKKGVWLLIPASVFCLNQLIAFMLTLRTIFNSISYTSNSIASEFLYVYAYGLASLVALIPYIIILILSIFSIKQRSVGGFGKVANILMIVYVSLMYFLFIISSIVNCRIEYSNSAVLNLTNLLSSTYHLIFAVALFLICKWLTRSCAATEKLGEMSNVELVSNRIYGDHTINAYNEVSGTQQQFFANAADVIGESSIDESGNDMELFNVEVIDK